MASQKLMTMDSSDWAWWLPVVSGGLSVHFVLLSFIRIWRLRQEAVKTAHSWQGPAKFLGSLFFAALQLVILVLLTPVLSGRNPELLAIPLASTAAALSLVVLSRLEHRKSVARSDLIVLYFVASLLLDGVWLAAPSTWAEDGKIRLLAVVQLGAKVSVLIAENWSKEAILLEKYRPLPPEVKASALEKTFFSWINPILADGYHNILVGHELPNIDRHISSGPLRQEIVKAWSDGRSTWLPLVLYRCLRKPFLSAAQPRVFQTIFKYSQPLLIQYTIRYLDNGYQKQRLDNDGFLLIVAAIVIYVGLALSSSIYQHELNRLGVMVRGALTGLIHSTSLTARAQNYDDTRAVALVSTDVTALESVPGMIHEAWALAIEFVIGIVLLARQVGWLWLVPVAMILGCSQISRYVANNLKARAMRWNAATQRRLAMTSAMISSIKNIKALGLQEPVTNHILDLRQGELEAARSFRLLMWIYNVSANALGLLAPVLTIVVFTIVSSSKGTPLNTETAFSTIAILTMITHPANMLMTIVPRAVAAYASFERIQDYVSGTSDTRTPVVADAADEVSPAISLTNVTIAGEKGDRCPLENITFNVSRGAITIVSGPVGAGKTVLARAVLGEVAASKGTIALSTKKIAYCSQAPWLPGKSIKEVIRGPMGNSRDDTLYNTVVQACCLLEDFDALPGGDNTLVGGKGSNLSGGQRQRVALARALYQRCDIAILDDAFSGLDGKTEDQVIANLFGAQGLYKELRTTVIWITNSATHFHLADNVIILDGNVKGYGPWDELRSQEAQISKFIYHIAETSKDPNHQPKDSVPRSRNQVAVTEGLEDLKRKNGDFSLYGYWIESAGYFNVMLVVIGSALYSGFSSFPQYWVKLWTEDHKTRNVFYMVGYALLYFAAWVSTCGNMWTNTMRIAPRSGRILHQRLVQSVARATLYYFSTTETGSILNRFGQDIMFADKQLPEAFAVLDIQISKIVAQATLLFMAQPFIALALPFCIAIIFGTQRVYLRTSRQLRILELESRADVYSSLLDTTQGLETIRAFGWQLEMARENTQALDRSQKPHYLLMCLQRWLNVVLDLLVAGIAVGTIALAVAFRSTTTGGQIGVALVLILSTTPTLLRLVTSWTDLEVSLGAISRLRSAERDIPKEDEPMEDLLLAPAWPSLGRVEFKDVTAAYDKDAVAFSNLSLEISPGQTVVICGRTGSGKSSVLLSLLRLLDIKTGSIFVDGLDITRVPRKLIRQRCFITVSQEPFMLPGAPLRFNLDSFGATSDETLLRVLEQVGLRSHFSAGTSSEGSGEANGRFLGEPLSTLPTLSGGQAQLLAVGRALVQAATYATREGISGLRYADGEARPIILLDEITSSLDAVTEASIYDIIQESFIDKGYTVIMVTHKLAAFVGRMRPGKDAVVWMKEGRLASVGDAKDFDVNAGI